MSVIPSRTLRSTCTERGSAATCSLNSAIGGRSESTRPPPSVLSADDQAPLGEPGEDGLVVTDVPVLVGVDEDEVEVALEAVIVSRAGPTWSVIREPYGERSK